MPNPAASLQPLLIDAGPSPAGWSEIGRFVVCPRLAALAAIGALPNHRDATTWGSMGHSGLAHLLVREALATGAQQVEVGTRTGSLPIWSASDLLEPPDAVLAWCQANDGEGSAMRPEVESMLEEYGRRMTSDSGFSGLRLRAGVQVLAAEVPVVAVLADHATRGPGLWVVDVPGTIGERAAGFEIATAWIRGQRAVPATFRAAMDGGVLKPWEGPWQRPIFLTRRIDLVTRSRAGLVQIVDHKCLAHPEPADARGVYAVDRGMQAFHIFGQQLWGDHFGGVELHAVGKRPNKRDGKRVICLEPIPAVPLQISTMARRLFRAHWQRAELIDDKIPAAEWDDAGADVGACKHRYGRCDALEPICSHWDIARARELGPVPRPYGLGTG